MLITSRTNIEDIVDHLNGAAHSEEYSIFGQAGLEKFKGSRSLDEFKPIYGHYLLIRRRGNSATVSTDFFGLAKIFLYKNNNLWAISDSIVELTDFAKRNGGSLTPYEPSAYALHLPHGLGQQLTSLKTMIQEITLIPHWLSVEISDNKFQLKPVESQNFNLDFSSSLKKTRKFFASLMQSYLESGLKPLILLSGGLDSRCTAAIISGSISSKNRSQIASYTMQSAKFASERKIAEELSKCFGFSQSNKLPQQRFPSWSEWRRAFLGSYSNFEIFSRFSYPNTIMGGGLAENVKPFYDWNGSPSSIQFSQRIPGHVQHAIIADIEEVIDAAGGASPVKALPEMLHYQALRNRFHFGKDVRESIFNFPPMAFAMIESYSKTSDLTAFHRIIYEASSDEVFSHPFDDESKYYRGSIPKEWTRQSYDHSDVSPRQIFSGENPAVDFENLSGSERSASLARKHVGEFLSPDFFEEAHAALNYAKSENLLDERMTRSALTQLIWLRDEREKHFPGLFPDLMAVLTFGLMKS